MTAKTRRTQILMTPDEHRRLGDLARARGVSLAELIRSAVKERYFSEQAVREEALADLLAMEVPMKEDWEEMESWIEEGHGGGLP